MVHTSGAGTVFNLLLNSNSYQEIYRSVHNVRIERLWVDVTGQVGAKWSAFFSMLELRYCHGLQNRATDKQRKLLTSNSGTVKGQESKQE